jgi:predicted DNA-binding transcriptional regulator AlpA
MKLLSKKQVLAIVPVSHATLRRWEDQGIFPTRFHIGGNGVWKKAFWREDEVLEWIDNQTVNATHDD